MIHVKKISQVLLTAGAFIFVSFYGLQAQAQDATEAAINENAPISIDTVAVVATSPKKTEKQASTNNSAISDEEAQQAANIAKDIERRQKLADDASAAEKAYENSVKEYKEAASALAEKQRAVANAQSACQRDENSEECQKLAEVQQKAQQAEGDLAKKKIAADNAYKEKYAKEKLADEANASATSIIKNSEEALSQAKQKVKDKENAVSNLETTLKEATSACEYSKTLTSRQGKADAEKYCGMQTQVEDQLATAKEELAEAEEELAIAQADYESYHPLETEHKGKEYKAFSTATGEIFQGTYSGNIDYSNTGDVFSTITRRAARILVGLKPIVYVFAGFGLIAFAFMAIFNKISWKWFANIAIGLFLVANMGRLIEYMVYTVDDRDLAAAEKPSEFGDHLHAAFADTEYAWVDVMTPYMPPEIVETPDTSVEPPAEEEKESDIRGFCEAEQKGGGLFGGGGFASCVKDLISAGKKAVDTAKKVQNTVDTVENTIDSVKYAGENIGHAIDKIGEGNIEDSFNALSQIGKNVNYIVGSTGGMMDNVMSNTIDIANNVQDISKSRDEQAELQARRDKGEATGGFTGALMGQTVTRDEDGKVTGVEHRWGGNLEYDDKGNVVVKKSGFDDKGNAVEGDIASNKKNMQNTGQLGFMDVADDVVQKSSQVNQTFNEASQTAGALTGAVANFSAFGSDSINDGRQRRQAEKKAEALAQKNAERAEADKNRLNSQAKEVQSIENQLQERAVQKNESASMSGNQTAVSNYSKNGAQTAAPETSAKQLEDKANAIIGVKQPEREPSLTAVSRPEQGLSSLERKENIVAEVVKGQEISAADPVAAAQVATSKLEAAQNKAQQAEEVAEAKTLAAQEAVQAAEEAMALAKETGDPADMRRANELQRRAELAMTEASQAQAEAQEAQEPLKELEENARQANIEAAIHSQKISKEELDEVEKNVSQYRNEVGLAQKNVDAAYLEAQEKIAAAQADPNDENAVVAAKKAYDEYVKRQQELSKTQKKLEDEIKRRNDAEQKFEKASEKGRELTGK